MEEKYLLIAERIRELREIYELPVESMARDVGVEPEVYAGYEASGKDIPISVLYHISQKFGVELSEILSGEQAHISTLQVCRRGKGQTIDRFPGYMFEDLAPRFGGKVMEPLLVTLTPCDTVAALVTHEGQEFNLVLEGTVALIYDGKEILLSAGDAVYFDPTHPHTQKAAGEEKARFLTVITE